MLKGWKHISETISLLAHCGFLYSEEVPLLSVRGEERRLLQLTVQPARMIVQLFSKECTRDVFEPLQMHVVSIRKGSPTMATAISCVGWPGQSGRVHCLSSMLKGFFLRALAVEGPWTCFGMLQLTTSWCTQRYLAVLCGLLRQPYLAA